LTVPKILNRKKNFLSPWVSIYEDEVLDKNGKTEIYHSILVPDYVCILAINNKKMVPLVKQFRHAVNKVTLELPAGLCDNNKNPEEAAVNELFEETGFESNSETKILLKIMPCTGRLSNKGWCYFVDNISKVNCWKPESNLEVIMVPSNNLLSLIDNQEIQNGMHIATILKAKTEGLI